MNVPRMVYVRDVATCEDTHWERRSAYHYVHDGKIEPSLEVAVCRTRAPLRHA